MAIQQTVTNFGGTQGLYRVRINDRGADGGSNYDVTIGDLPAYIDPAGIAQALKAFGEALAEAGQARLVSITRITAEETPIDL
ncbi:hypothetical protein ABZ883_26485 [Streptomyces sp. NPDC046977]|uniref:hypothetical protein n=1 Tax=Streptomyces sp. NPDC046977 TaxID=3154703 RepID=UPI0033D182B6